MTQRAIRCLVAVAVAALVAALTLGSRAALAQSCDPGICVGNPCTISGTHDILPPCFLDFSGRDVTIASDARLVISTSLCSCGGTLALDILARNLTHSGQITAIGSRVRLRAEETLGTSGRGTVRVRSKAHCCARVDFEAVGSVMLVGGSISATGESARVNVTGASIDADTALKAKTLGEGTLAVVRLDAASGDIITRRRIRSLGTSSGEGNALASVEMNAPAGDVTVANLVRVTPVGFVGLTAGADLTLDGDLITDGANIAPTLSLSAGGDVTVNGRVTANPRGIFGEGGSIRLRPGPAGNVAVNGIIDGSYRGSAEPRADGATIEIGPACAISLAGSLVNSVGGSSASGIPGGNRLIYRETLDVTGATLRAEPLNLFMNGGNVIQCRCVNPPACDGGCVADPIGLGLATVDPPATITPVDMAACP